MSKQIEAMKLALKALEESKTNNDSMEFHDRKNKAITALIEALAEQPAQQKPMATLFGSLPVYDSPAQQEPEAYFVNCTSCGEGKKVDRGNHHPWCFCGSDSFDWGNSKIANATPQVSEPLTDWVSVDVCLPEQGGYYLVTVATDEGPHVDVLMFNKNKRYWELEGEPTFCHSYYFEPTHWAHRPEAAHGIMKGNT